MVENELIINSNYDFDQICYVPIRFRKHTGFSKITYANIEVRWPVNHEIRLIWEWFKKETVYRTFGFSQPPLLDYIENSVLPDLTVRERHLESVEFLIVQDSNRDKSIGFCVVYEAKRRGDPNQEVDFAIADEDYFGKVSIIKAIEICILSYIFAVRGALSVFWVRRKQIGNATDGGMENSISSYNQKRKRIVITRLQFKDRLKRIIESEMQRGSPVVSILN